MLWGLKRRVASLISASKARVSWTSRSCKQTLMKISSANAISDSLSFCKASLESLIRGTQTSSRTGFHVYQIEFPQHSMQSERKIRSHRDQRRCSLETTTSTRWRILTLRVSQRRRPSKSRFGSWGKYSARFEVSLHCQTCLLYNKWR